MSLTIFHLADAHLGAAPVAPRLPSHIVELIHLRRFDAFYNVMHTARETKIDAVLIAGDLFDRPRGNLTLSNDVRRACEAADPVEVVIIPGNHDYYAENGVWDCLPWPHNVTILHGPGLHAHRLRDDKATIYAHGWAKKEIAVSPFCGPLARDLHGPGYKIVLAHGSELNTQPADWKRYGAFYGQTLLETGARYAALGHLHWTTYYHPTPATAWAYPGSFASTGLNDTGPKFYNEVLITDDRVEITPRPAHTIEFEEITLRGRSIDSAQTLADLLLGFPEARRPYLVVWANIVGTLPAELRAALPDIRAAAAREYAHLALYDRTVDRDAQTAQEGSKTPLDEFLIGIDELVHSETDKARIELLERVREHGLTAANARAHPSHGNLYQ